MDILKDKEQFTKYLEEVFVDTELSESEYAEMEQKYKDLPMDEVMKELKNLLKVPFKRAYPKIGRNENCVCGSEKKYKHCCEKELKDYIDSMSEEQYNKIIKQK